MNINLAINKCSEIHAEVTGAIQWVIMNDNTNRDAVFNLRILRTVIDTILTELIVMFEMKGREYEVSQGVLRVMDTISMEAKNWIEP